MKRKILNLITFLMFFTSVFSQNKLKVNVFDTNEKTPIAGALVYLQDGTKFYAANTDEFGSIEFKKMPKDIYSIKVRYVGYDEYSSQLNVYKDTSLTIYLAQNQANELDKIIVSSTRAKQNSPISLVNINKEEIRRNNNAQDVPQLLKNLPSIITTTDAGNGVGYTGMWIRGTDVTRINVTINGIPLNDPESHGVYWVDVPNLMDITDNLQIQRGVGSSTMGAGAFGASINIRTNRINTKPYSDLLSSFGSFGTYKTSIGVGTGLLNNHFVFEGRYTKTHSNGYIDNAWANTNSIYLAATFQDDKTIVKASIFKGFEETYQAWGGVPKDSLKTHRTFNPYKYENEIDHYEQNHANIHIIRSISKDVTINLTGFYVGGKGYYEQFKENQKYSKYALEPIIVVLDTIKRTDLIRRKWLDNDFFGANYNVNIEKENFAITLGGQWNNYLGGHFGEIIWMKYAGNYPKGIRWYDNNGIKNDVNVFAKADYKFLDKLTIYADLQYRRVNYKVSGIDDDLTYLDILQHYNFFNPKAGAVFQLNDNIMFYASYSVANREPKRSDFTDAPQDKMPKSEQLKDIEVGFRIHTNSYNAEINFYNMDYKDQLILTGQINDVGEPIVTNVPKSYRRGVELIFSTKITSWFTWSANATFSKNIIQNFTEYVDNWDTWVQQVNNLGNTNIAFSPEIIANNIITIKPLKKLEIDFISKYVSRTYLDNTSSLERSLKPYFVNDLNIRYSIVNKYLNSLTVSLQVFNLLNEDYITNAWVYSYISGGQRYFDAGYFPQAFRNYMLNISFRF